MEAPESYGLRSHANAPLHIEQSQVRASGTGNSYGVYSASFGLPIIDHSEIAGVTNTVFTFDARIGATRLNGGPVLIASTCAGVYDESFTFFAGPACP